MTYAISTTDSAGTQAVGEKLSRLLKGGEVIELVSDLGGGKTTFVQGLARALGHSGEVTSPTFTISRLYKLPSGLELHHYDLYRLGQSGVVGDELEEDLRDPEVITVIEWAKIIESALPKDRLTIEFEVTGDTERKLHLSSGGPVSRRLIEEMKA